jgi:hypothetical protein
LRRESLGTDSPFLIVFDDCQPFLHCLLQIFFRCAAAALATQMKTKNCRARAQFASAFHAQKTSPLRARYPSFIDIFATSRCVASLRVEASMRKRARIAP